MLAVRGLTETLNPQNRYAPYGHCFFNVNPPYMTDKIGPGPHNWGKICEALTLMRSMCGSDLNLDQESLSRRGMIEHIGTVGCRSQRGRVALALMTQYQQSPSPGLKALIQTLMQGFYSPLTDRGDFACYLDPSPNLQEGASGINGYLETVLGHGPAIRALSRWYQINGDAQDLELAGKLSQFLIQPRFWEPEAEPKFFVGAEHAHFKGHVHAYTQGLMGLLWYADVANDARLKEFVREGYEYVRHLGIARIGLFGEGCTVGDMTVLAVKLSDLGVADYWEQVDQYVRNHLTELQITDLDLLKAAIAKMPPLDRSNPQGETTDRVAERNLGAFFDDAGHPTLITGPNFLWVICGNGNIPIGIYYAWESIVRCTDGMAQVNLLLNRASPWLDLDSYLPYEGKVVITNKEAQKLSVRIPAWVDKRAVTSRINGRKAAPFWLGNYLVFDRVKRQDRITIEFPMVEATETYTVKWKHHEFWMESNWATHTWQPQEQPDRFTCRFRGNTLIDISPRVAGVGYPLYLRDHYQKEHAPLKKVTRFVGSRPGSGR
jgi:hypothetical protein